MLKLVGIVTVLAVSLGVPSTSSAGPAARTSKAKTQSKGTTAVRGRAMARHTSARPSLKQPVSKLRLRGTRKATPEQSRAKASVTGRAITTSGLPSRIQNRALKAVESMQSKSVLSVSEASKTFGTQMVFAGSKSKFIKGQGHVSSPVETKVLVHGKQEISITQSWGQQVGPGGVVGTARRSGPKQRQHTYSVSPLRKGVLMEMSVTESAGVIVNRRAYEVNATTGKRMGELPKFRLN